LLILKGMIGGLFNAGFLAALLLVPAGWVSGGTWRWPRALVFLATYFVLVEAGVMVLAIAAPASLKARLRGPVSRKQPVADRIVTAILMLSFIAWIIFIPIDVFHLKLLPTPPFVVSLCGGVLFLAGYAIIMTAIYQNSFAIPVVEDQTERGQVLVDTGLYAHVRHPLYLGVLPFFAGLALWLESYAALIATSVVIGVLVARIFVEESTLRRTLPHYGEYMQKVRYRLIPFVW
jgi:protein-S-isoprenylcysteine O-methyltransferase Ste14